jgi:peptidyl-prolyl cis-trans isomerase C
MKLLLCAGLLLPLCSYAQTEAPAKPVAPAPAATLSTLPPSTVVATVDGTKVTASDLQAILRALPPASQQQALRSPRQFLDQFGLLRKLSAMAEQAKLHERSPLREQLEYNRMVGMAQAELLEAQNQIHISTEDAQKQYEANKAKYEQAKVKVIYIPFSANAPAAQQSTAEKKVLTEAEAKEKAEKLLVEIKGGADFVKLVKEHSGDPVSKGKDGDFGNIKRSDRIPEAIKTAVFALKPGEVSEPVRQPNGFYLFRLEESSQQTFDQVKDQITAEMRQARFSEWMQSMQKSIDIKIENEAAFAPVAPAIQAAPPTPSVKQ